MAPAPHRVVGELEEEARVLAHDRGRLRRQGKHCEGAGREEVGLAAVVQQHVGGLLNAQSEKRAWTPAKPVVIWTPRDSRRSRSGAFSLRSRDIRQYVVLHPAAFTGPSVVPPPHLSVVQNACVSVRAFEI